MWMLLQKLKVTPNGMRIALQHMLKIFISVSLFQNIVAARL